MHLPQCLEATKFTSVVPFNMTEKTTCASGEKQGILFPSSYGNTDSI